MNFGGFHLILDTLKITLKRAGIVMQKPGFFLQLTWLVFTIPLTLALLVDIIWIDFYNNLAQANKLIFSIAREKNAVLASVYFPFYLIIWYITIAAFFVGRFFANFLADCGKPVVWLEKQIGIV